MSEEQPNQPTPESFEPPKTEIDAAPNSATPESVAAEINTIPTPKVAVKSDSKSVATSTQGGFLEKVGLLWQSIVKLVRSLLPASLTQKLSDPILNAAIAAILIVTVGLSLNIFSAKPAEKIAKAPVPKVIESPANFSDFVESETPQQPQPIAKLPEAIASEKAKSEFKSNLPDLVAPTAPKAVEIVPPPPLTPEQSLIAGIQNKVDEITARLGGGLVKSFEANFSSSRLTVKVAEDWYGLSEAEQNQIVNQMFKEANLLDFSNLEVLNKEGKLIARSPVVGSEMIILDRIGS
ncbi:hypothetical protein [Microcoleus sp.]|uniref:hypothetical protein n=1 Tax=Microcoleus sp. TaxID=44472 RepID=UPI003524ADDC